MSGGGAAGAGGGGARRAVRYLRSVLGLLDPLVLLQDLILSNVTVEALEEVLLLRERERVLAARAARHL